MAVSGIAVEGPDGGALGGGGGARVVAGELEEGLDSLLRRRGAAMIGSINNVLVASASSGRTRTDDFLDAEMGKHDYDWLLTPPGTPSFSSSNATENHLIPTTTTKNRPIVRSTSAARASRLSTSQTDNIHVHSTKPIRSSSVTRPSISTTHPNPNTKTSSLNTSTSSSITSRPSTPSRNPSRTAPPSSRPLPVRSVNPAKTRPNLSFSGEKPRPPQTSRPSTPTITRRPKTPVLSSSSQPPITARSPSAGRVPASQTAAPRSSSPAPRNRTSFIDPSLFSHEAPPNLRTKLPEKPGSAGRTRPGIAMTVRANSDAPASVVLGQKHILPSAGRCKGADNSAKQHQFRRSDHEPVLHEIQKLVVTEPAVRRGSKAGLSESSGFGRTISKMSLNMALKHMDIRQSIGGIRSNMIYPHSIRPGNASKSTSAHGAKPIPSSTNDDRLLSETGRYNISVLENGHIAPKSNDGLLIKGGDVDLYGSSRYDTMLLKEDTVNTNWLLSIEDKSDQSPVFDRRFDPPPEPFGPL